MINATTVNKLNEMRLTAMADSYRHQLEESSFGSLSFEERFRASWWTPNGQDGKTTA